MPKSENILMQQARGVTQQTQPQNAFGVAATSHIAGTESLNTTIPQSPPPVRLARQGSESPSRAVSALLPWQRTSLPLQQHSSGARCGGRQVAHGAWCVWEVQGTTSFWRTGWLGAFRSSHMIYSPTLPPTTSPAAAFTPQRALDSELLMIKSTRYYELL